MTDFKAKYFKYKLKYLELKKSLETSGGYISYPSKNEIVVLNIDDTKRLAKFLQFTSNNTISCSDYKGNSREFYKKSMISKHLYPDVSKWWDFTNFNNETPAVEITPK
jgi:hypothetical protein